MKTFKEFIKKTPPMAIIDFGERKRLVPRTKDGTPMAIIDFGNRDKKKEVIKESYEDSEWFSHHNENKHLGYTPKEQQLTLHNSQHNDALGEHLKAYTRYSAELNKSLLDHAKRGREHPKSFQDDMHHFNLKDMDNELAEHKLDHPLHVYSGVGFDPQKLAAEHPDNHIHLPAYTSTSIHKDIAREFASTAGYGKDVQGRHIIHMELPKGQTGKYVGNTSHNPFENEFVLPRNTTIKIHPNPEVHTRIGQQYTVHKASIVPKENK